MEPRYSPLIEQMKLSLYHLYVHHHQLTCQSQIQELLEKSTWMNPGWYHGWILLVESMSQLYLVVSKLMYSSSVQYRTTSDRVTHIDEFSKSQFLTPFKHLTIMIFTKLFYKSLHYRI